MIYEWSMIWFGILSEDLDRIRSEDLVDRIGGEDLDLDRIRSEDLK